MIFSTKTTKKSWQPNSSSFMYRSEKKNRTSPPVNLSFLSVNEVPVPVPAPTRFCFSFLLCLRKQFERWVLHGCAIIFCTVSAAACSALPCHILQTRQFSCCREETSYGFHQDKMCKSCYIPARIFGCTKRNFGF